MQSIQLGTWGHLEFLRKFAEIFEAFDSCSPGTTTPAIYSIIFIKNSYVKKFSYIASVVDTGD
jgi:hypothetical protein